MINPKNLSGVKLVGLALVVAGVVLLVLSFGGSSGGEPRLEYKVRTVTDIVSAAYKVYGRPELGMWVAKVIITNVGTVPVYDLRVSYNIEGYSDWSEGGRYPVLLPGSTVVVLYYPIISSEVTKLTSPTPSRVNIKITYTDGSGKPYEIVERRQVNILGRHDFIFSSLPPEESLGTFYDIFSNYPLVAAWVTPTDPVVTQFGDLGNKVAGGAGAMISDEEAVKSLQGMWELSVYNGIQYKTEPQAFWTGKLSQYVMYPRDVIKNRIATCLDSTIFFASLAISQGLKPYIVLMPGHAFLVVELPKSGQLVPIETTMLNSGVSFEAAVRKGVEVFQEAMRGPHIIIDIQQLQAIGITPPELEPLPPDILQRWGITMPGQSPSPSPSPPPSGSRSYSNPSPRWSISYPADWTVDSSEANPVEGYVSFESDVGSLIVMWSRGKSWSQIRSELEEELKSLGVLQVVNEGRVSVSGVSAVAVLYGFKVGDVVYAVVARYFEYGAHGFAIVYTYPAERREMANLFENMVASFRLT